MAPRDPSDPVTLPTLPAVQLAFQSFLGFWTFSHPLAFLIARYCSLLPFCCSSWPFWPDRQSLSITPRIRRICILQESLQELAHSRFSHTSFRILIRVHRFFSVDTHSHLYATFVGMPLRSWPNPCKGRLFIGLRAFLATHCRAKAAATARERRTCPAATCSATGRLDTAAAALIEIVPDLTAATSSGAACFWTASM